MSNEFADTRLAGVAAAIAEPARARMLCCLMDGYARTNTELAVLAEVSPSTASVHLAKLREQQLVHVLAQGKHRYYTLAGADVAAALEALMRVAGLPRPLFVSTTPERLRNARTCYDHMAGTVAVAMHDYMARHQWLHPVTQEGGDYQLSEEGAAALERLGLDVDKAGKARRRFACACLDWSERRSHLGGALGAALLSVLLRQGWIERDLDSRALGITRAGRRHFKRVFELDC
ncbi:DNA-binding transcriptional ArsR family regulator [Actimicrobium sp. GrIS 1.19]|uniref:ArsR/SmtB family transcription factor n=1 Tax=Actimicrobium sp. GrIS 1.19 TaxID=3071708 RepID=UPI002DFA7E4D|nr:DNA-binding transcriptional ArsR family regulator [Actimicrobium sp. GrIS 1.19]